MSSLGRHQNIALRQSPRFLAHLSTKLNSRVLFIYSSQARDNLSTQSVNAQIYPKWQTHMQQPYRYKFWSSCFRVLSTTSSFFFVSLATVEHLEDHAPLPHSRLSGCHPSPSPGIRLRTDIYDAKDELLPRGVLDNIAGTKISWVAARSYCHLAWYQYRCTTYQPRTDMYWRWKR